MFAYPFFALTRQQLKTENNKLNIYTQYLMKSTFETIRLFFHRPVGFVELLILYACVQFYTPRASDYRLISKTVWVSNFKTFCQSSSRYWTSVIYIVKQNCYIYLSCTYFISAVKLHWLDKILLYTVTDQYIAFLVPLSCFTCWALGN